MSGQAGLEAHLAGGDTRVCRCWLLRRRDGTSYGFTDHDSDIAFDGWLFRAETGMTPGTLEQSTGLSVDNTEVAGALTDTSITEADIEAGRFDGAEVTAWLVNWANPLDRMVQFRGTLGEITRAGGLFKAELRGLSEALNRAQGLVYQSQCTAVLGDARCGVDLTLPAYSAIGVILSAEDRRVLEVEGLAGFDAGWFEGGTVTFEDGAAAALRGLIRSDELRDGLRILTLWDQLGAEIEPGGRLRVQAGCDKRAATCRSKFGNFLNFRGCPHIPGDDWLMTYPVQGGGNTGGKLVS